jgi:hypothetical protein
MTTAEVAGDDDAIRDAWAELQPTILPDWIRKRPGTRPWFWWKLQEPNRRERIDGKPHPFDNKARSLHIAKSDNTTLWRKAYSLHRGVPGCHIMPFDKDIHQDFMTNVLHGRESQIWEPEWSYLVRHNLLLPDDSPRDCGCLFR